MPIHKLKDEDESVIISKNIMNARKRSGKTLMDMAAALGVTYQAYQRYEHGSVPTITALRKIAKVIGVHPCELCGCCDD